MKNRPETSATILAAYAASRIKHGYETMRMRVARETLELLQGFALTWDKDSQSLIPAKNR
jgi:hypothetical protein